MSEQSFDLYHIPSIDEVKAYAQDKHYRSDPEAFYKKYTRAHWKQNGQRIKKWTMLFDSWEEIDRKNRKVSTKEAVRPEYLSRVGQAENDDMTEEERKTIVDDINRMIGIIRQQQEEYERGKHQTDDNVGF